MPAIQTQSANTFGWVIDQTVWHITGYQDGYFWGVNSVLLTQAGEEPDPSGKKDMTFFASITPQGQAHITFLSSSLRTTVGTGRVTQFRGQRSFEMQMSSGPAASLTVHWAYMLQVEPGQPQWNNLPGAGVSVDYMVGKIPPPQPAS